MDRDELASLFNERTKGILLNNPLNPVGKVYTLEELQFIADLAKKYDTLVVSDEAHEWVTHKPHVRIGMYIKKISRVKKKKKKFMPRVFSGSLPGMFERTITIGSATKTFSVSGWRLGWAYGPVDIMNNIKTVHRGSVYYTPTPQQVSPTIIILT